MKAEYPFVDTAPSGRVQAPLYDCFGVGTAASGIAQAAGAVTAAGIQSSAARDAAKLAADATTHGADLQDAANKRAETFNREQAEALWRATEADRHANYDQWAAKRRYVGSIGQMLGLGAGGDIPAYVASADPRFTEGGPSGANGVAPGRVVMPRMGMRPPALGGALAGGVMSAGPMPGVPPPDMAVERDPQYLRALTRPGSIGAYLGVA